MDTTVTLPKELPSTSKTKLSTPNVPKKLRSNYLVLGAVLVFCMLLGILGFPLWIILIFGVGMSTVLFLLSILGGAPIVLELDAKELEKAIHQDLFEK